MFPAAERFAYQGHLYQTAMLVGADRHHPAPLRDGSTALTGRKRNYPQGLAQVPSDDAQLLAVIGEGVRRRVRRRGCTGTGRRGTGPDPRGRAEREAAPGRGRGGRDPGAAGHHRRRAARHHRGLRCALGASGVSVDRGLDRHWRNARTLASHNPRVYKARILGDYLINGKDPVSNLAALGRGGQGN